jgi:hypothetical protein
MSTVLQVADALRAEIRRRIDYTVRALGPSKAVDVVENIVPERKGSATGAGGR